MNNIHDDFVHTTKPVLSGEEHVAITKQQFDYFINAYQKGYEDGFNAAYEKLFWNETK